MSQEDTAVADTVASLEDAIAKLPTTLQEAVVTRYLLGMSYREAAFELRISIDTYRGRLSRAMALLRKRLTARGVAGSAASLGAVLTGARNAGAAPPPAFVAMVLARAKPAVAITALSAIWWKAAAGIALAAVGSLFFWNPARGAHETEGRIAPVRKPLFSNAPKAVTDVKKSRAEEWEILIADRLTGPLATARREVADEDNGFYALLRLSKAFDAFENEVGSDHFISLSKMVSEGQEWDGELVEAVLAAASPIFDLFDEVLAAPDFQFPEKEFDSSVFYLSRAQSVANVLKGLQAEVQFRDGNISGAVETAFEQLDFGSKLRNGQGALIHDLVGRTIWFHGQNSLMRFAISLDSQTTPSELGQIASRFAQFADERQFSFRALGTEYSGALRSFGRYFSGTGSSSIYESLASEDAAGIDAPDVKDIRKAFMQADMVHFLNSLDEIHIRIRDSLRNLKKRQIPFAGTNSNVTSLSDLDPVEFADYLSSKIRIQLKRSIQWTPHGVAQRRLVQTRIALQQAYHSGTIPQELSGLVPQYLPEIPVDPFDGKPLKYFPGENILYSIGMDRIDAQGQVEKPGLMKDNKELVIPLPESWRR